MARLWDLLQDHSQSVHANLASLDPAVTSFQEIQYYAIQTSRSRNNSGDPHDIQSWWNWCFSSDSSTAGKTSSASAKQNARRRLNHTSFVSLTGKRRNTSFEATGNAVMDALMGDIQDAGRPKADDILQESIDKYAPDVKKPGKKVDYETKDSEAYEGEHACRRMDFQNCDYHFKIWDTLYRCEGSNKERCRPLPQTCYPALTREVGVAQEDGNWQGFGISESVAKRIAQDLKAKEEPIFDIFFRDPRIPLYKNGLTVAHLNFDDSHKAQHEQLKRRWWSKLRPFPILFQEFNCRDPVTRLQACDKLGKDGIALMRLQEEHILPNDTKRFSTGAPLIVEEQILQTPQGRKRQPHVFGKIPEVNEHILMGFFRWAYHHWDEVPDPMDFSTDGRVTNWDADPLSITSGKFSMDINLEGSSNGTSSMLPNEYSPLQEDLNRKAEKIPLILD